MGMFSSFKKIIEVIGVILVNKILQVSDGQFYNTSSVPCILCSPPQVRSLSITVSSPLPISHLLPPFPPGSCHSDPQVHEFCLSFFLLCSIPFSPYHGPTPSSCKPVLCIYESVSILLVSLSGSLDSTYE